MKRLRTFTVVAVFVAALFAFSPVILPLLGSVPGAFRDALESATDVGQAGSLTSGAEAGAAIETETDAGAESAVGQDEGESIPERPATAAAMTVDYVHDGDTLFLLPGPATGDGSGSGRVKVRLIGLDTPEVGDAAECFGREATEQLRALLPVGSSVWVTGDVEPTDRYDRSLFYLWAEDGRFVNYELVASGAAESLTISPNDTYAELLRSAENAARSAGVGLWGAC